MKRFILLFASLFSVCAFSQAITVNTTSYSVPQLVNTVLINSPCVQATNVTWKTGTNFSSSNGIGFFSNTNPNFPMPGGVILSTGNAMNGAGPNMVDLNDGSASWPGDSDLEATLAASGISMNSVNATVLEFDFTPISSHFNFDFLFASEEYGNFQCEFSDAFAFLLTNTSTGVTTNLAIVPGTNTPISVVTIRDFLYNSSCPSANSQYFGTYNGGSAAAGSATNFNGQTKLLNASATLNPNVLYHIKLVIADRTDNESDSAIFISSDSFNIGQDVLGQDLTVAGNDAVCFGDTYVINSGLNPADYTFTWKKNGVVLSGQTGPSLSVTGPGNYELTYQITGCTPITDSVTIEYYPQIVTANPINLYKCNNGSPTYTYDLSINTPIVKTGLDPMTVVTYHSSLLAATNGTGALPLSYVSAGNQTIYVRIKSHNSPCFIVKPFDLLTTAAPIANQPLDLTLCARSATVTNGIFNIGNQTPTVLGGQSPILNTVTYYNSLANATSGTNPLPNVYIGTNNTVIYVRVQNATDSSCYSITSFTLHISLLPPVDTLQSIVLCEDYILPPLVNGNYFTAPNGGGEQLFPGDVISESQTIYIFNQPGGPTACSAGSSFKVTIIDPLTLAPASGTYCGRYVLNPLLNGNYYTGPGATGTLLQAGAVITSTQQLYVYFEAVVEPFCTLDVSFNVTILPSIELAAVADVFDCVSYILPPLSAGNYFTAPNGGGDQIAPGTAITATQTIYVYAETTGPQVCKSQKSFTVFIGFDAPVDISQCNGYTLPALPIGNYYSGPAGTGTLIPAGTILEQTTTVYIYIPTNDNCMDDVKFTAHIAQPLIDVLTDISVCGSYILPNLVNGAYFTEPAGTGTELFGGHLVTSTQTIYIFKRSTADCFNEISFTVTVSQVPGIDSRSDIDVCNSYELTALAVGNYYTGPGGTGTLIPAGTVLTTSQRVYIYAMSDTAPFCTAENSFVITIYSIEADDPADVTACDRYVLPALTIGNYYRLPGGPAGGEASLMQVGDVINASQTIYIYTESGERINCTDENIFNITINYSPVLAPAPNRTACNSYTLPILSLGDYYTGANKTGTMLHAGDVISATQTLYVYAETGTVPNCTDEKSFVITIFNVDEMPNVATCENYTLQVLITGRYYTGPGGTGSVLQAGQVINSTQTIYIYSASPFSPVCYDESSFAVTIVDTPVAYPVSANLTTVCDEDGTNDGVTSFDLTTLNATILGPQTASEFTIAYYATQADAIANLNPITATTLLTVYVKVTNTLTPNCYDLKAVTIRVNTIPELKPVGGIICYDSVTKTLINPYTIPSGLTAVGHTFEWFNEFGTLVGIGSSYQAILPGEYSVIATNTATGCQSVETFVSVEPSMPAIVSYSITEDFANSQSVTVITEGTGGDYEYQLDSGLFQDSPIFNNVSSGFHTIIVRDKNGCGTSTTKALVVNYPKYFTPNGDGYHDTWNIIDLKAQSDSKINIFDRYGKMITQIVPNGAGWDGTFNGKPMPSTDYWFIVNYEEDGELKEFRAHFAMKR